MIELKLPSGQKALYDLLDQSGDVPFVDIYLAMGGDPSRASETDAKGRHYAQSWICSRIAKLNRRLKNHGLKVIPGRLKRTYCLARVA